MREVRDWALLMPREDDTDNFAALCKNKRAGISLQGEWLAMATSDRVFGRDFRLWLAVLKDRSYADCVKVRILTGSVSGGAARFVYLRYPP
jgi:hypothetical protein